MIYIGNMRGNLLPFFNRPNNCIHIFNDFYIALTSVFKVTYTTIKNTIAAVAEELGKNGYNSHLNDERNKDAFVMGSEASDINTLLSRSETLAGGRKEGGK